MYRYALYMENKDIYEMIAELYMEVGDINMSLFYRNAALGYEIRAKKLTMSQAAGA